ncbi:MAG: hypothetical protein ACE5NM_01940 [Sedimentisphaerales bacterium]
MDGFSVQADGSPFFAGATKGRTTYAKASTFGKPTADKTAGKLCGESSYAKASAG